MKTKIPYKDYIIQKLCIIGGASSRFIFNPFALRTLKYSLSVFLLLIGVLSFFGAFNSLSNPINPFFLVSSVLFVHLISLMISLINAKSLLVLFFKFIMMCVQFVALRMASNISPFIGGQSNKNDYIKLNDFDLINKGLALSQTQLLLFQILSHLTWTLTFIGILLALTLQFIPNHYDFHLGGTLQINGLLLYEQIGFVFDFFPKIIGMTGIPDSIYETTIAGRLDDAQRSIWASWVLKMIMIYGLLPRLLLLLYCFFQFNSRVKLHYNKCNHMHIKNTINIIDKAPNTLPKIIRKKKITKGNGFYAVAIECMPDLELNSLSLSFLNDRNSRSSFLSILRNYPANSLCIIVDAMKTPDRGTLSLMGELLDLSSNSVIYLNNSKTSELAFIWQEKLDQIMLETELLLVDSSELTSWIRRNML